MGQGLPSCDQATPARRFHLKNWKNEKCGRQESNLHGLPHGILSPARLPVPPRPHGEHMTIIDRPCGLGNSLREYSARWARKGKCPKSGLPRRQRANLLSERGSSGLMKSAGPDHH